MDLPGKTYSLVPHFGKLPVLHAELVLVADAMSSLPSFCNLFYNLLSNFTL